MPYPIQENSFIEFYTRLYKEIDETLMKLGLERTTKENATQEMECLWQIKDNGRVYSYTQPVSTDPPLSESQSHKIKVYVREKPIEY